MPGQDVDIQLLVGKLAGEQEGMRREIGSLHKDLAEVRQGQEVLRRDLTSKIDAVGYDVKTLLSRQDEQDKRCDRRHPDGTNALEMRRSPSSETLGSFFTRVGIKALESVTLAAIIALIIFVARSLL